MELYDRFVFLTTKICWAFIFCFYMVWLFELFLRELACDCEFPRFLLEIRSVLKLLFIVGENPNKIYLSKLKSVFDLLL